MPLQPLKTILGNNISKQRKRMGLTQKELAVRLNITPDSVAHIEQGINAPKLSRLEDIATHLQCSIQYLFSDDESASLQITSQRAKILEEMLTPLSPEAQETILSLVAHATEVLSKKEE